MQEENKGLYLYPPCSSQDVIINPSAVALIDWIKFSNVQCSKASYYKQFFLFLSFLLFLFLFFFFFGGDFFFADAWVCPPCNPVADWLVSDIKRSSCWDPLPE